MTDARLTKILARLPAVLAALALATGCRHQPEPASPWVAPNQPVPPLEVVATPLNDAQAIERIVESWNLLGASDDAVGVMLATARQFPQARLANDAGARRWLMLTVYRAVQGQGLSERFDSVRGLVDALQTAAATAPETMFCRAFLRFILLQDTGDKLAAGALERAIVVDLERDLATLVEQHPQFVGPGDWQAQRFARELKRVRDLLAAMPTVAAAADPTPTAAPAAATPASP